MATTKIPPIQIEPVANWWTEIGRTTLGSAAATMDVTIPATRYLTVLVTIVNPTSGIEVRVRCNDDTGTNYTSRLSQAGAADSTWTSYAYGMACANTGAIIQIYAMEWINIASSPKTGTIRNSRGGTAIASAPGRDEGAICWVNNTNAITKFSIYPSTGTFGADSEIVVLGHN